MAYAEFSALEGGDSFSQTLDSFFQRIRSAYCSD
jgi:hypothetical protein